MSKAKKNSTSKKQWTKESCLLLGNDVVADCVPDREFNVVLTADRVQKFLATLTEKKLSSGGHYNEVWNVQQLVKLTTVWISLLWRCWLGFTTGSAIAPAIHKGHGGSGLTFGGVVQPITDTGTGSEWSHGPAADVTSSSADVAASFPSFIVQCGAGITYFPVGFMSRSGHIIAILVYTSRITKRVSGATVVPP